MQLEVLGLKDLSVVYANLSAPALCEDAIRRQEGRLTSSGAFVFYTGKRTGRSPKDRFFVLEPESEKEIAWGKWNQPVEEKVFEAVWNRACVYLKGKEVYVQELSVGSEGLYRLPVCIITERAVHSWFARIMFRKEPVENESVFKDSPYVVLHVPGLELDPAKDATRSEAFIGIHLGKRRVLIAGTGYSGEMKKSVFSVMNYLLPQKDVLSMHCAANCGDSGQDAALFFGLSGTGKTSLSADSSRWLVGDDEHGWGKTGIFNLEGGCYAKLLGLSEKREPEIFRAVQRFGALLENVTMEPQDRIVSFEDASLTENTRGSYPLEFFGRVANGAKAGHAKRIFFLSCDAFGVLPPVAKLEPLQALYYFLTGYTANVGQTEVELREPKAVFSPCFGAPFMPLAPYRYAELLQRWIQQQRVRVWLVNTGWVTGPVGTGYRIPIEHTRSLVARILDGTLEQVPMERCRTFGWELPTRCPGVPDALLNPRRSWPDPLRYREKVQELVHLFHRFVDDGGVDMPSAIRKAGPVTGE